jgi:hypothetical protein
MVGIIVVLVGSLIEDCSGDDAGLVVCTKSYIIEDCPTSLLSGVGRGDDDDVMDGMAVVVDHRACFEGRPFKGLAVVVVVVVVVVECPASRPNPTNPSVVIGLPSPP